MPPSPPDYSDLPPSGMTIDLLTQRQSKIKENLGRVDKDLRAVLTGIKISKVVAGFVMAGLLTMSGYMVKTTIETTTRQAEMVRRLDESIASQQETGRTLNTIREKVVTTGAQLAALQDAHETATKGLQVSLHELQRQLNRRPR